MHNLTISGNLIEAAWWGVIALTLTTRAIRVTGRRRRLWAVLAVAFMVFAVSDVVESQTGAWWRPLWLLALKAACITVFLYGAREYRNICQAPITPIPDTTHEAVSSASESPLAPVPRSESGVE